MVATSNKTHKVLIQKFRSNKILSEDKLEKAEGEAFIKLLNDVKHKFLLTNKGEFFSV